MRIVEQRPFLDVYDGSMPSRFAILAASLYSLCDGMLIIYNPLQDEEK